jgi:hypothetical protein
MLYQDLHSKVKWEGKISSPFYEQQGVRQGGTAIASVNNRLAFVGATSLLKPLCRGFWLSFSNGLILCRITFSNNFPITLSPFYEQQGVRQGGILSPELYKVFINPLLDFYKNNYLGFRIGSIQVV